MTHPAIRHCKALLLTLSISPWLGACFVLDGLSFQDTKVKIVTVPQQEKLDPETVDPEPQPLSAARLARRLTLDLAQRLPYDYEVESLVKAPLSKSVFIEYLLTSASAPQAIAALHARMWHLNDDDLPDLDEFAASQDTFKTKLTNVRHEILKEPLLYVRYILQEKLPFRFILQGRTSITSESIRAFWGLTDVGQAWPDDSYRLVESSDGRPEAGILATNGWLSAFPGRRESPAKHRGFRTLSEITCRSFEGPNAHLFTQLTDSDFAAGLEQVSTSHKSCTSCHGPLSGASASFTGVGSGSTFETWKTFSSVSGGWTGTYNGSNYSNLSEFAKLISEDPQFLRCERDKIASAILQRPIGSLDQISASLILDRAKDDHNFLGALLPLFESNTYAYGPIGQRVKGTYLRQASGLKLLRRHHFEAFARLWAPTLADKGLDMALDPGIDEVIGEDDMIPSGPYWHAVDKFASQLAHAITTKELETNMTAVDRQLLDLLPNGTGFGASDSLIEAQIIALWKYFTTETLTGASETLELFKVVWQSAGPINTSASFKTAWSMVLYAMFTHPHFLTY